MIWQLNLRVEAIQSNRLYRVVLEMVPLRGEKNSSHAHKTGSWYLSRFFSKFLTSTAILFILESQPPGGHPLWTSFYPQKEIQIVDLDLRSTSFNVQLLYHPWVHNYPVRLDFSLRIIFVNLQIQTQCLL